MATTMSVDEVQAKLVEVIARLAPREEVVVTDFAQHLQADLPSPLEHLILPHVGRANAAVCLAQWRDSASNGGSYDWLSEYVARRNIELLKQIRNQLT